MRKATDGFEYETFPVQGREDWLREMFRLDASLDEIKRRVLDVEPELGPIIEQYAGLRLLRWHSAEECLFSFLCTVNNHIPRIKGMIERLCQLYGQPLAEGINTFPTTERIASLREEDLAGIGFGYRSRTLIAAAKALLQRSPGWLESQREVPYAQAHAALIELPSVGRKVADCVCLFGLWHDEAVPIDTHLWQACCQRYFPDWQGKSLTDKRYAELGRFFRDRFGNLAGWAHQYLFYDRLLRQGSASRSNDFGRRVLPTP